MDWLAVSFALADQNPRPVLVIDQTFTVRVVGQAIEGVLGRKRHELIGKSALELCVGEARLDLHRLIDATLFGRPAGGTLTMRGARGEQLHLELVASRIGEEDAVVCLTVLGHHAERSRRSVQFEGDVYYEVSVEERSRFCLIRVRGEDAVEADPCYSALHDLPSPCPGCPLPRAVQAEVQVSGITRVRDPSGKPVLRLVHARKHLGESVALASHTLKDDTAGDVVTARIEALAARAMLTERERDVLQLLVLGRGPEEIATALEISPRTAKFHQANLLGKLGADSRQDILRLLL